MVMNLILSIMSLFLSLNPFMMTETEMDEEESNIEYKEIIDESIQLYYVFSSSANRQECRTFYYGSKELYQLENNNIEFIYLDNTLYFFDNSNASKRIVVTQCKLDGEIMIRTLDIKAEEYYLLLENNQIHLFVNYDSDIIAYQLDASLKILYEKHYQGEGIQRIDKVLLINDFFYYLIYQDNISGYDFRNAGSSYELAIGFAKVDKNYEVIDVIHFDSEKIIALEEVHKQNQVYLSIVLNDAYYLYSTDLNQKIGLKFNANCIFAKTMVNNANILYLARILKNGIEVIDMNRFELCYETSFLNQERIEYVKEMNDYYYSYSVNSIDNTILYHKKIGIYYIGDFKENIVYYDTNDKPSNVNLSVQSLNKTIYRSNYKTIGNFDSNQAGEYSTHYFYNELELVSNTIVYPMVNIRSNFVYPLYYSIKTNMKATLNGYEIASNYCLSEEGKYTLVLYDEDSIYQSYDFEVRGDMIELDDSYQNQNKYDYYMNKNEYVRMEYKLKKNDSNSNNQNIEVLVNKIDYQDFDCVENSDGTILLYVYLSAKTDGLNLYEVNSITYGEQIYPINEVISIYTLKEEAKIEINAIVNKKIELEVNINDEEKTLVQYYMDGYKDDVLVERHLIYYLNKTYSIEDYFQDKRINKISVGVLLDTKYINLIDKSLFEIKLLNNKNNNISVEIVTKERTTNIIRFIIDKTNNLSSVRVDNQIIYQSNGYNYDLVWTCSGGVLGLTLCFIVYQLLRTKIIKKKKNKE